MLSLKSFKEIAATIAAGAAKNPKAAAVIVASLLSLFGYQVSEDFRNALEAVFAALG